MVYDGDKISYPENYEIFHRVFRLQRIMEGLDTDQGTGFLVRSNHKLFLVTAGHVFGKTFDSFIAILYLYMIQKEIDFKTALSLLETNLKYGDLLKGANLINTPSGENFQEISDDEKQEIYDEAEQLFQKLDEHLKTKIILQVPKIPKNHKDKWTTHPLEIKFDIEEGLVHSSGEVLDILVVEITDKEKLMKKLKLDYDAFDFDDLISNDETVGTGTQIIIPGFPYGFYDKNSQLPVVVGGTLGSKWGIHFNNRPIFLTDGNFHPGQSGSPVLAKLDNSTFKVLGVHSEGYNIPGSPQNFHSAVYIDGVRELIKSKSEGD